MKGHIDDVSHLLDKARRSQEAAQLLFEKGSYDFAVSRAYYVLFYVSEALLSLKGLSYSKHSAVIAGIYQTFVKGGELPSAFHQTLHRAFEMRNRGDYLSDAPVTEGEARQLIGDVKKQLQVAVEKLQKLQGDETKR